jgi:progesterone-induced-blocking factor 1
MLLSSREKYKSEYEMRLRDELDVITTKTSSELDKIKNNSKEMYERENR